MSDEKIHAETSTSAQMQEPMGARAIDWAQRIWRPAGTGVAVLLALLVTWHVVNGKHGLSVWQKERSEDRRLQQEIQDLQHENADMQQQIDRLKNDPDAIEREAREKLHYAKPGEVIYTLPGDSASQQTNNPHN
jgi:cell division protein FtsB